MDALLGVACMATGRPVSLKYSMFQGAPVQLDVSPEVRALLERRMILVEEVRKVIEHAERTGDRLEDLRTGRRLASHRPVEVTYWVEYSTAEGGGFVVHNAYSHRMQVAAR